MVTFVILRIVYADRVAELQELLTGLLMTESL
jgi:hypothetical protein